MVYPADISISILQIKPEEGFWRNYERFGSGELDIRAWLKEKNSNVAHVATNEGYDIVTLPKLQIKCPTTDAPEKQCYAPIDGRYSLFFNSQVVTRDDTLTIGIKIYENDQVYASGGREKLNKMSKDFTAMAATAIDKGLITKSKGDEYLEKLAIFLFPITTSIDIYEFFVKDDFVTAFEIELNRNSFFAPRLACNSNQILLDDTKFQYSMDNLIGHYIDMQEGSECKDSKYKEHTLHKHPYIIPTDHLSNINTLRYVFTTKSGHLTITFELVVRIIKPNQWNIRNATSKGTKP